MIESLIDTLRSYQLSGYVQWWIFAQTRIAAVALGQTDVITLLDRLLPVVERANAARRDYTRTRGRHLGSDDARVLDQQIDRQVSSTWSLIDALIRQEGPLASAARRLQEAAFPGGLAAHVNAPYLEQATHNAAFVAVLADPAHADVVAWLHLDAVRETLERLAPAFLAAIGVNTPVTARDVQAAERAGENATLRLVCAIVGAYDEDDPRQRATRDQLLRPYLGAQELLRREYQRRRSATPACDVAAHDAPAAEPPAEASPTEASPQKIGRAHV